MITAGERIHVIGIAGSGAAGAAILLQRAGAQVDGCDADGPSPYTGPLEAARIPALAKEVLAELRDRSRKADDDILAYDRRIDGLVRHSEPMQDS